MKEFQADSLTVQIHGTPEAAGKRGAREAACAIREAIAQNGAARIILACAHPQNEFLSALVHSENVDWSRVTIFHMDEYIGLNAANLGSLRSDLKTHTLVHVTRAQFHPIHGEAEESEAECRRYSELLQKAPIDVICLGISENGHIALNDSPVANFADPLLVKTIDLGDSYRNQQADSGCFPGLESVPRRAITLTVPALMSARKLICVASGLRKAAAVRATIEDPVSTLCTATAIRRHQSARLFLDQDSASYLDA